MRQSTTLERFFCDRLATPVGILQIVSDEQVRLKAVLWTDSEANLRQLLIRHYGECFQSIQERNAGGFTSSLEDYMTGNLNAIAPLRVAAGGTPFQRVVWDALRHIPAGATTTYGELAASIGRPTAARAVGMANGSNPVSVVVPCHRVIGVRQSLTGYAGGVERKAWLLRHEGALLL